MFSDRLNMTMKPICLSDFIRQQEYLEPEILISEGTCPPISGHGFALEKSIATSMKCAANNLLQSTRQDRFSVGDSAGNDNDKPDLVIKVRKVAGSSFSGDINIEIKDESAQGTQIGLRNNFDPTSGDEVTETSWVQSGRKKIQVDKEIWLGIVRAIHTKKFEMIRRIQEYLRTSVDPTELHKKTIVAGRLPFGKVSKIGWKDVGNKGTIFTQNGDKLEFNINEYIEDSANILFYEDILRQKKVHFIYINGRGLFSTGLSGAPAIRGIPRLSDACKGAAQVEIRLKASGGSYTRADTRASTVSVVRHLYCNQDPTTIRAKRIYMENWAGNTPSSQAKLYMFDDNDKLPPEISHAKGNEVARLASIKEIKPTDKPYKWSVRMDITHRTTSPTLQFTTRITSKNFADSPYKFDTTEQMVHFLQSIP